MTAVTLPAARSAAAAPRAAEDIHIKQIILNLSKLYVIVTNLRRAVLLQLLGLRRILGHLPLDVVQQGGRVRLVGPAGQHELGHLHVREGKGVVRDAALHAAAASAGVNPKLRNLNLNPPYIAICTSVKMALRRVCD